MVIQWITFVKILPKCIFTVTTSQPDGPRQSHDHSSSHRTVILLPLQLILSRGFLELFAAALSRTRRRVNGRPAQRFRVARSPFNYSGDPPAPPYGFLFLRLRENQQRKENHHARRSLQPVRHRGSGDSADSIRLPSANGCLRADRPQQSGTSRIPDPPPSRGGATHRRRSFPRRNEPTHPIRAAKH